MSETPKKIFTLDDIGNEIRTSSRFQKKVLLDPEGLQIPATVRVMPDDGAKYVRFSNALNGVGVETEEDAKNAYLAVCEYLEMAVVEWDFNLAPTVKDLANVGEAAEVRVMVLAGLVYGAVQEAPKDGSGLSKQPKKQAGKQRRKKS